GRCRQRFCVCSIKERCGRRKEKPSGYGAAEVEQPIIVARRTAYEHILKHQLSDTRGTAIADEVSAKLAAARLSKGHVVSQNLELFPILLDDGQRAMGRSRLYGIIQLDIGQLPAADDSLLSLGGKSIPCLHIMKIFLNQNIAAAGEGR